MKVFDLFEPVLPALHDVSNNAATDWRDRVSLDSLIQELVSIGRAVNVDSRAIHDDISNAPTPEEKTMHNERLQALLNGEVPLKASVPVKVKTTQARWYGKTKSEHRQCLQELVEPLFEE